MFALDRCRSPCDDLPEYQIDHFKIACNHRRSKTISRKEVIQPQVPLRLPCYDFIPITDHTFGACFLAVGSATSGTTGFRGVTGGVYKARERIQRSLLICAY